MDYKNVEDEFKGNGSVPACIIDTVWIPHTGDGGRFEFFRDIADKDPGLCSLKSPRRIGAGERFLADNVRVSVHHWNGDQLELNPFALVKLKLNDRLFYEAPASYYGASLNTPLLITDTDDLHGGVEIPHEPGSWAAREVRKIEERIVHQHTFDVPDLARKVLPGWFPGLRARYTRTVHEPCWRTPQGSNVVKVTIHGRVKRMTR